MKCKNLLLLSSIVLAFSSCQKNEATLESNDGGEIFLIENSQEAIQVPVANAGGNQSITFPRTIQLEGNSSHDLQGIDLSYRWQFVSTPNDSLVVLSDNSLVNPTFVPDQVGQYVLELIVDNGYYKLTLRSKELKLHKSILCKKITQNSIQIT